MAKHGSFTSCSSAAVGDRSSTPEAVQSVYEMEGGVLAGVSAGK